MCLNKWLTTSPPGALPCRAGDRGLLPRQTSCLVCSPRRVLRGATAGAMGMRLLPRRLFPHGNSTSCSLLMRRRACSIARLGFCWPICSMFLCRGLVFAGDPWHQIHYRWWSSRLRRAWEKSSCRRRLLQPCARHDQCTPDRGPCVAVRGKTTICLPPPAVVWGSQGSFLTCECG